MESGAPAGRRRRAGLLTILRVGFLLAAVGFGIWGFRTNGEEILAAMGSIGPLQIAASALCVLLGLGLTGVIWSQVLRSYGHRVAYPESASVFFVGQIGKYIPGSVWSLAAQADMARRHAVPARTTVSVGLIFLWIHTVSAAPIAAVLVELPPDSPLDLWWLRAAAFAGGLLLMAPPVLRWIGRLLAGSPEPPRVGWAAAAALFLLMQVVWTLYGAAAFLAIPPESVAEGEASAVALQATGAFALAYVVGVLVIFAPAGLGVREATFIALMAPALGGPNAAAASLMIRLVHTVCDFAVAGIAWSSLKTLRRPGRRRTVPPDSPAEPGQPTTERQ